MDSNTDSDIKVRQPVIVVRHLYKKFGEHIVLNDFSLDVAKGENMVVLGKSGSGKSVLVKCIVGLIKPDSGSVTVLGENIEELKESELDKLRIKLGFLFQSNALFDSMSIRDNLEFTVLRHCKGISQLLLDEMVAEVLHNVGLADTAEMMPVELSGGMAKRIALARALILKPEIIFYDEPTAGLDPVTAREIDDLILKMQKKYHTSSVIISHDMNCVKYTADRIALLLDGKCYVQGSYFELSESKDEKISQFFKDQI
ncbi:ATP-binding cassette domain-containing protein [Pedobacter gandavensis]|uniref:ABC transporter ATP-binding protein n=1 Tax=Pedobacter TaxID=84567 RepID=UPI001C99DF9B|nr:MULTISPECIES: ATP-binding cassette domain-containing protein [Pedobacter]WGQ09855.1 ATP-binding cassette domain-containing protein [Pedobacter gandavensis]